MWNANCHLQSTSLRFSASGSFRRNYWCPFFIHLHLKIILFYLKKKILYKGVHCCTNFFYFNFPIPNIWYKKQIWNPLTKLNQICTIILIDLLFFETKRICTIYIFENFQYFFRDYFKNKKLVLEASKLFVSPRFACV